MKKIFIALLFVILCVLLGFASADVEPENRIFEFPSSLERIEDEAFKGTAIEIVILPEGFLYIGENVFLDVWSLKDVYIPDSVAYIADSALMDADFYTIHGVKGSCAEDWAKQHKVPFIETETLRFMLNNEPILYGEKTARDVIDEILDSFGPCRTGTKPQKNDRSLSPKDRPEFHPIDFWFP